MDINQNRYDQDEDLADVGGAYVVPSAKVRLPDYVTKMRKSQRPQQGCDSGTAEREA